MRYYRKFIDDETPQEMTEEQFRDVLGKMFEDVDGALKAICGGMKVQSRFCTEYYAEKGDG